MLKKQKLTTLLIHVKTALGAPVIIRGFLILVSLGLVAGTSYAYPSKQAAELSPKHVSSTTHHVSSKKAAPVASAPSSKPAQVATPVPAPAQTVTTTPVTPVPAPKVVVPTPHSSVSHLKPTTSTSSGNSGSGSTSSGSSSSSGPSKSQPPASYSSFNWSGYMDTSGAFTGVSGAWTVPNVSGNGTNTSADGTWIGIGGVTTSDLIQTGTQDFVSARGHVTSSAFYEVLPQAAITITSMTVVPGDSMSATISELSPGAWTITIADQTDNESYTTTLSYASAESSAEWIEEDPGTLNGGQFPFDTFGMVTFSGATTTVNGSAEVVADNGTAVITLVNNAGQPIAVPSNLNSAGNSFSITQ